jgi:hypothetical protein
MYLSAFKSKLPVYGRFTLHLQDLIYFGKMTASEKSVIGGQRGRMSRFQHMMFGRIDQFLLGLGISAPKDKYQTFPLERKSADHRISEMLPATVLV